MFTTWEKSIRKSSKEAGMDGEGNETMLGDICIVQEWEFDELEKRWWRLMK